MMNRLDDSDPPSITCKHKWLSAPTVAYILLLIPLFLVVGCGPLGITDPQSDTLYANSCPNSKPTKTWPVKRTLISNEVNCIAADSENVWIATASGSSDKTIRLWDVNTGKSKKTLKGHSSVVSTVAFSPNGTMIAGGSWDKTVRLWDVTTGKRKNTLKGHTSVVRSVMFSPDGKTLASESNDETIRLWDVETGTHRKTLKGHTAVIFGMLFSPDGKTLASASVDKTIRL